MPPASVSKLDCIKPSYYHLCIFIGFARDAAQQLCPSDKPQMKNWRQNLKAAAFYQMQIIILCPQLLLVFSDFVDNCMLEVVSFVSEMFA